MSITELKLGSSDANTGGEVTRWGKWFERKFKSYAAPVDGYYGLDEERAVRELQRRVHPPLPITGRFDLTTAAHPQVRYTFGGQSAPPPAKEHRPIWVLSLPGSGGWWGVGPGFDVGEWVKKDFNLNHQPVGSPIGGYLGLLGGDPGLSYNEVIEAQGREVERLLAANPDIVNPKFELWIFAYSQSADGAKETVARLFGDGGRFRHLRNRINGLVLFGDPTRRPGPTRVGNNPKGWGIARKTFPVWLEAKTWSITTNGDMYACTTDDTLLPLFYEWFVKAETELSFVGYSAGILIPAISSYLGLASPLLGALGLAPLAALAGTAGLGLGTLGQLLGSYGGGASPNPELVDALSAKGLLTPAGIRKVVATLAALPGIQTHGEYHLPKPEFDGRTGLQVAYEIVRDFRR